MASKNVGKSGSTWAAADHAAPATCFGRVVPPGQGSGDKNPVPVPPKPKTVSVEEAVRRWNGLVSGIGAGFSACQGWETWEAVVAIAAWNLNHGKFLLQNTSLQKVQKWLKRVCSVWNSEMLALGKRVKLASNRCGNLLHLRFRSWGGRMAEKELVFHE